MESIPYYDFSYFPVNDDILLKLIDSAVNSGFKMIFINFGDSFPWSLDNVITSEFAYSEKLIDKIVNICRQYDIILVPVLSIMIDSDFILRDRRYNYLINEDRKINGLDPSATGVGNFIEELIDDIYSILVDSEYLLIELPPAELAESNKGNDITVLIKRLSDTLRTNRKNLIIGCNSFCDSFGINEILDGLPITYKIHEEKIQIFNGHSYQLYLETETLVIKDIDYRLFHLSGNDGFIVSFDSGYFASNYNMLVADGIIKITELEKIDSFFYNLDNVWVWIRKSREDLSLIYRNTDQINRTRFLRAISKLSEIYTALTENSVIIVESLKKEYQPGVLKQWMDSKMDSVYIQLSELEFIAKQIGEGN